MLDISRCFFFLVKNWVLDLSVCLFCVELLAAFPCLFCSNIVVNCLQSI